MRSSTWLSWPALALTAFSTFAGAQKTSTKSYCTTAYTSKSTSPVKTQSVAVTVTKTPTKVVTVTPSTTKTPPPKTTTLTVATVSTSVVTAPQITDTFTSVSTIITTITVELPTISSTSIVTASTDITVVGSATTVPTPSGFIPIQSSVGQAPSKKRGILSPERRSPAGRFDVIGSRAVKNGGGLCPKGKPQYPKKVSCLIKVTVFAPAKTSTQTGRTTRTITAPVRTSTVFSTTTLVVVSTFLPSPASTTISTSVIVPFTVSTTPSTTIVSTTSSTNTVLLPGPTSYAQCQSDNFIGGDSVSSDNDPNVLEDSIGDVANAYDCCVLCAQRPGCELSGFYNGRCEILYNGQNTCTDPLQLSLGLGTYAVSNGCVNARRE